MPTGQGQEQDGEEGSPSRQRAQNLEIWECRNAIQLQSFLPMTSAHQVQVPFAKPGVDEREVRREGEEGGVKVCSSHGAVELRGSALGEVSECAHGGHTLSLPSSCQVSPDPSL